MLGCHGGGGSSRNTPVKLESKKNECEVEDILNIIGVHRNEVFIISYGSRGHQHIKVVES